MQTVKREMERRVYFKNLSGLRFFAAFAVILHHVEQYKYWARIPSSWGHVTTDALGHKAVSFFFVLSGFLITYLLFEENRKTSTISIKDFYVRRILRIWPVYYLVVGISLFLVPFVFDLSVFRIDSLEDRFGLKLVLFLLILPNLLRTFSPNIVAANQLWSIGVEEQFYVIWPGLVKLFLKRFLLFLFSFIAIKILVTIAFQIFLANYQSKIIASMNHIWILLKVEQMAIGAIGAWALFNNKKQVLSLLYHRLTFILSVGLSALMFVVPFHHWFINYIEAVFFMVIILNLSTNPSMKISLEHPLLTRLGNISYGIYMYHAFCITICIYTLIHFNLHQGNFVLFNVLLYGSSILLTLTMAFFSYEYFEKFFLSLKERFMIVKSGKESISEEVVENALSEKN